MVFIPRLDGMPVFVAIGVDFVIISRPEVVFCPLFTRPKPREKNLLCMYVQHVFTPAPESRNNTFTMIPMVNFPVTP